MANLPLKRYVKMGDRSQSLYLEDAFWDELKRMARERRVPLGVVIAEIVGPNRGSNLSSAVRVAMFTRHLAVRPARLYAKRPGAENASLVRGARRSDGRVGRSLALFDQIGVRKRKRAVVVVLSDGGHDRLFRWASELGVMPAALAAYVIEVVTNG